MSIILGVSAHCRGPAAALVVDGVVKAVEHEARFSRDPEDTAFPKESIRACLNRAGLLPDQVDWVGFHEKPFSKLEHFIEIELGRAPFGFRRFARQLPAELAEDLRVRASIAHALGASARRRCLFVEAHESLAASAFFASPFKAAAILMLAPDGIGWGFGEDNRVSIEHFQRGPHTLQALRGAFAAYLGVDEEMLAELGRRGEPHQSSVIEGALTMQGDEVVALDASHFELAPSSASLLPRLQTLLGGPKRCAGEPFTQRHLDVACSVESVLAAWARSLLERVHTETRARSLCVVGNVGALGPDHSTRSGSSPALWERPGRSVSHCSSNISY